MQTTRSAPASWAASMTHSTMGTPQTGCRTLASDERIRVPWPAAMMSAVSCAAIRLRRVAGAVVGAAVGWGAAPCRLRLGPAAGGVGPGAALAYPAGRRWGVVQLVGRRVLVPVTGVRVPPPQPQAASGIS